MFITIVLILYEWYFVITNQDTYVCQIVTTNLWKFGTILSSIVHTIGVVYWVSFDNRHHIDTRGLVTLVWDIGSLHSTLLWFLCFSWTYYKMSRRSFAELVNKNLNLSIFVLEASCITLFEACITTIPRPIRVMIEFQLLEYSVAYFLGVVLTMIGLVIMIAKIRAFRKQRRKDSIMSIKDSMIMHRTIALALVMITIGVITNTSSLYAYLCNSYQFNDVNVYFDCTYYSMYEFACNAVSLFFGCFSICFNVISVIIP